MSAAKAAENEDLDRWIAVNDPIIERQFARRGRSSERTADMPLTTSALEQLEADRRGAPTTRRYALRNREPQRASTKRGLSWLASQHV